MQVAVFHQLLPLHCVNYYFFLVIKSFMAKYVIQLIWEKLSRAVTRTIGLSMTWRLTYKAGYDTGPTNPLPQDEREEVIFAKQKVVEDAKEYFEEMKKQTEE